MRPRAATAAAAREPGAERPDAPLLFEPLVLLEAAAPPVAEAEPAAEPVADPPIVGVAEETG